MPLLGQKGTNCVLTSFCLFSHIAMSLSWLPSGVTITYTHSTGAPVAATVEAPSECGIKINICVEWLREKWVGQPQKVFLKGLGTE